MNFQSVEFEAAAGRADQLKKSDLPEIVFSGKSNVGKSSLINKRLPECRFVDLPGYGYAKVSQGEKQRWAKLMQGYFDAERNVALVIQILDMRHEPTADDFDMINFLIERDLPFLVVCTKSDKLNKTQFNTQNAYFEDLFREHEIPFIPYSSQTGFGLETLKQHIEAAVLGN